MHISIYKSELVRDQSWYWHFVNKGRITADSEAFPTKQHAVRAAKGCVRSIVKQFDGGANHVFFSSKIQNATAIRLTWAGDPSRL